MNTNLQIGDRVKHCARTIQLARDYWLGRGRHDEKTAAKDELDRKMAVRGTVTGVGRSQYGEWVAVKEDDGQEHQSLPYMW